MCVNLRLRQLSTEQRLRHFRLRQLSTEQRDSADLSRGTVQMWDSADVGQCRCRCDTHRMIAARNPAARLLKGASAGRAPSRMAVPKKLPMASGRDS